MLTIFRLSHGALLGRTQYETAAHRYHKGKSVSALLYLARAWFRKANRDQNFGDLQKALQSCKEVRHRGGDELVAVH